MRHDLHFTPEAERFILERKQKLKSEFSLAKEYIVLFNVLKVEKKDQYGKVIRTEGPFVYVGLERSKDGLLCVQLPASGKDLYLSGFDDEFGITFVVEDGRLRINQE